MPYSRIPDNNFDFLRLFLAMLVVVSHAFSLRGVDYPFGGRIIPSWISGDFAVDCFFIISGFLITHSWIKSRGVGDYIRKRALRIYPGFIVAMLICGFFVLPLASGGHWLDSPRKLTAHFLRIGLLQHYIDYDAFTGNPQANIIMGSTWTIFYEVLCYALVPLVVSVGLVRRPRLLLGAFAAAILAHALTANMDRYWRWRGIFSFDICQALRFLAYFLGGMCFYVWGQLIPRRRWAMAAAALILAATLFWRTDTGIRALALLGPVLLTYIVFSFAFSRSIQWHHFARYGDFSYGVYIYSSPLQQLLVYWTAGTISLAWMLGLSIALSLAVGALSWHLVEKHFLRLKTRPAPAQPAPAFAPEPATAPIAAATLQVDPSRE